MVYTYPYDKGLRRVWRVGMGVMLLNMQIFEVVKKPWFGMKWVRGAEGDSDEYLVGEDWWFCERVEEAGLRIYIDQDLSNEVRHWSGETGFGHEMCLAELLMQGKIDEEGGAKRDAPRKGSEVSGEDELGRVEDSAGVQGEEGCGGEVGAPEG